MSELSVKVFPLEKRIETDGEVAFGEKVAVSVAFPDGGAPSSGDFRLRIRFMGADVAAFPLRDEQGQTTDEWSAGENAGEWIATLNLNTVQLRKCFGARPHDSEAIAALLMLDCIEDGYESLHAEGRIRIRWWSANQTLSLEDAPAPVDIGEWATSIGERLGNVENDITRLDDAFRGYVPKAKIAEALAAVGDPSAITTIGGVKLWMASLKGAIASLATAFAAALFLAAPLCGATLEDMPLNAELMTRNEIEAAIASASSHFITEHQSLEPATNYTDSALVPYLKLAASASAFAAPRAYAYFRDLYNVSDTDTLVIFADGTHDVTGSETLSSSFAKRGGGPVAIYGGTNLTKLDAHLGTSSGASGYNGCLATIICPEVTSIGYMSFYTCYRLMQVELPKCVYVGTGAGNNGDFAVFCNAAFDEIDLPAAENICSYAFAGNGYLKRASIPSATSIGTHAFESCGSLELIDFGNSLQSVPSLISANSFADTPDDLAIVVPDALYDTWIASGNWATIAASKRFYKHSEWTKVRGDGVPVGDLSGYVTTDDLASITNSVPAQKWLSAWSWPDEWTLSIEAMGYTPAFSGYVPNKDIYAAVTAPGSDLPTAWAAYTVPETRGISSLVDMPDVSIYVEDPDGAVGAVTGNVAYASGKFGQFAFVAADTNGVERRAYIIAAPAPEGKTNELFAMEGENTERWIWTTNALARLNAVSTNAEDMVAHVQCRTAANRFAQNGTGTWMAPRALSRFGTGGRISADEWPSSYAWGGGIANRHWCLKENEDFFWPELRTNLWCYTVNCHESTTPKWNFRAGSAIAVAPHYIVSASHFGSWMWGPGQTWTDSPRFRFGPGTNDVVFCRSPRQIVANVSYPSGGKTDIEVCRVTNTIPLQCVAHFARESTLRALSPTMFEKCVGFTISSHQTVTPVCISPYGFTGSWSAMPIGETDYFKTYIPDETLLGKVPRLEHMTHMFDSASPFFLVAPNGRVVPVGQVQTAGGRGTGGPTYFNDDILDAIDTAIRLDSGGAEGLSYWSFGDLWSGVGTNSVPEL